MFDRYNDYMRNALSPSPATTTAQKRGREDDVVDELLQGPEKQMGIEMQEIKKAAGEDAHQKKSRKVSQVKDAKGVNFGADHKYVWEEVPRTPSVGKECFSASVSSDGLSIVWPSGAKVDFTTALAPPEVIPSSSFSVTRPPSGGRRKTSNTVPTRKSLPASPQHSTPIPSSPKTSNGNTTIKDVQPLPTMRASRPHQESPMSRNNAQIKNIKSNTANDQTPSTDPQSTPHDRSLLSINTPQTSSASYQTRNSTFKARVSATGSIILSSGESIDLSNAFAPPIPTKKPSFSSPFARTPSSLRKSNKQTPVISNAPSSHLRSRKPITQRSTRPYGPEQAGVPTTPIIYMVDEPNKNKYANKVATPKELQAWDGDKITHKHGGKRSRQRIAEPVRPREKEVEHVNKRVKAVGPDFSGDRTTSDEAILRQKSPVSDSSKSSAPSWYWTSPHTEPPSQRFRSLPEAEIRKTKLQEESKENDAPATSDEKAGKRVWSVPDVVNAINAGRAEDQPVPNSPASPPTSPIPAPATVSGYTFKFNEPKTTPPKLDREPLSNITNDFVPDFVRPMSPKVHFPMEPLSPGKIFHIPSQSSSSDEPAPPEPKKISVFDFKRTKKSKPNTKSNVDSSEAKADDRDGNRQPSNDTREAMNVDEVDMEHVLKGLDGDMKFLQDSLDHLHALRARVERYQQKIRTAKATGNRSKQNSNPPQKSVIDLIAEYELLDKKTRLETAEYLRNAKTIIKNANEEWQSISKQAHVESEDDEEEL